MDRDKLRALCEAATPGPWSATPDEDGTLLKGADHEGCWDALLWQSGWDSSITLTPEDLRFIAAARSAIPALLDELDEEEGALIAEHELRVSISRRLEEAEAVVGAVREWAKANDYPPAGEHNMIHRIHWLELLTILDRTDSAEHPRVEIKNPLKPWTPPPPPSEADMLLEYGPSHHGKLADSAEPTRKSDWWCCSADYPDHDETCPNYSAEPTSEGG
ncbi:MAG: hypothetical protein GY851_09410 [bacterium]|nr:hypothetical protein [bacterium]